MKHCITKLQQSATFKKWCWFFALYLASLIVVGVTIVLMRMLVGLPV